MIKRHCRLFRFSISCWIFSTHIGSCQQNDIVIAGYLPEYRNYININKPAKYLTDLILFSIAPNPSGTINGNSTCCLDSSHFEKARKARDSNHDLRILVSVGGGDRSNSFAELSSNKTGRSTLIQELVDLW